MASSKILENALSSEIQAAMGLSLLRLKQRHRLTLHDIGGVIGRTAAAVSTYICGSTEMGAVAWAKATARWPELHEIMLAELDEAEKAAAARQRAFRLEGVA